MVKLKYLYRRWEVEVPKEEKTLSLTSIYHILDSSVRLDISCNYTSFKIFNKNKQKRQLTIKFLDEILQ